MVSIVLFVFTEVYCFLSNILQNTSNSSVCSFLKLQTTSLISNKRYILHLAPLFKFLIDVVKIFYVVVITLKISDNLRYDTKTIYSYMYLKEENKYFAVLL